MKSNKRNETWKKKFFTPDGNLWEFYVNVKCNCLFKSHISLYSMSSRDKESFNPTEPVKFVIFALSLHNKYHI